MNRLTRIVCTLGPSTDDEKSIRAMINAGMDFARLNFSHGSYDEHKNRMDIIKRLSETQRRVMIIQDLPGPKIRVGVIKGRVTLKPGATIKLLNYQSDEKGTIPIMYNDLPTSVTSGSVILLCD